MQTFAQGQYVHVPSQHSLVQSQQQYVNVISSGVFIVNFEHISHLFLGVYIIDFEQVNVSWVIK